MRRNKENSKESARKKKWRNGRKQEGKQECPDKRKNELMKEFKENLFILDSYLSFSLHDFKYPN